MPISAANVPAESLVKTGSGPKAARTPAFKWVNTALGNITLSASGRRPAYSATIHRDVSTRAALPKTLRSRASWHSLSRSDQVPMVKRQKVEDAAGVLEFKGRTADDPEFASWLAEHRAHKGGKIRISQGGTGVRVMFTRESDMLLWKRRSEKAAKATS
jgi:hypothetical protein